MQRHIHLKANDTIVFIGDSITDAERHRQAYAPLGYGYVHFAANVLFARYPTLNLDVVNAGVSGDTIIDLKNRWEPDCLARRPNVLSLLVGVNDMWRLVMELTMAEGAASPEQYEVTYDQLLSLAERRCNCQVVLMEPFMFCRDRQSAAFKALAPYVEIVRRLADKHGAVLVPLQQEIDQQITQVPPEKWSDDMVHPHLWAHAWIAQQWLDATGL